MKSYKVKKDARTFGRLAGWYNAANLPVVDKANPTRKVGNKLFAAAYFVDVVKLVHDEMREVGTRYSVNETVAGPFATEKDANSWAMAHVA
jgi:hypothetical protein